MEFLIITLFLIFVCIKTRSMNEIMKGFLKKSTIDI